MIEIIPNIDNIQEQIELCKQYHGAFEYNDFIMPDFLDDSQKVADRIQFYKSLDRDRSRDTLHGVIFDIIVHSMDAKMRRVADERIRQSMDIAKKLNIRGVIFHTNRVAHFDDAMYVKQWLDYNEAYFRNLLKDYPGLEVYMENMFDDSPALLIELARRLGDTKRFGICLDYAHSALYGKDYPMWLSEMAPYIRHLHLNDNDLKEDLHLAIGQGQIDWQMFYERYCNCSIKPSVLIEVRELDRQKSSFAYLIEQGMDELLK